MKKLRAILVFAILLLFPVLLLACTQAPKQETSPLFWKVQSETTTMYLLGSIHVGTPDIYPLDPSIMDAFSSSGCLVTETDITSQTVENQNDQLTYQALNDLVGSDLMRQVQETIKGLYPEVTTEEIENSNFYGLLSWLMKASYEETGLLPEYGIDIYFINLAAKEGKTLGGVETYAQQTEDMNRFPADYIAYLLQGAIQTTQGAEELSALFSQWCNGDGAAIEQSQIEVLRQNKDSSEVLKFVYEYSIVERNARMVQAAQAYLDTAQKQPVFLVVGLAHLLGDEGVVHQLENLGYQVEQIQT